MFNSYDSVTPKRRPVIRVILATLLASTIFGVSISAASVPETEVVTNVAASESVQASSPLAARVIPVDDEFLEILAGEAEEIVRDAANDAAADELVEDDVLEDVPAVEPIDNEPTDTVASGDVANEQSVADVVNVVDNIDVEDETAEGEVVEEENVSAAAAGSIAQALTNPTADVEVLNAGVARAEVESRASLALSERELRIAELEAELEITREIAAQRAQLPLGEQAALLAQDLGVAGSEAEAQANWDAGYQLGGGGNLSSFHSTILPCESGSQANRDTVVGRTDDWGRAQINRPVWRTTFQQLTGLNFEENIVHPTLNGFMAAHIERVQGLSAWTCWRNR